MAVNILITSFILGLIIVGIILLKQSGEGLQRISTSSVEQSASEQYQFQVFCPVNKVSKDSMIYQEGD